MSQTMYRRRAILSRIRKALDAFYLLQKIDWEYDIRSTLERIMGLALEEVEFEGGKTIERALVILGSPDVPGLEVKAGWKTEELDLHFSRTVVQETIERREPILCENAKHDPRFMEAESLKGIEILSLISVPLILDDRPIGAFYVESKSPGNIFEPDDLDFLREFADTISPYLKVALTHQDHLSEIRKLRDQVSARYSFGNIIGRSEGIQQVFDLIRVAAEVDRTVLITGESGSGKELVSKAIHYNGHRRHGKFVVVDCSGLAEHLLESELFGHKKGAFTGAVHDKIGAFEEADGGTLFLDEVSDASKALQQKLRRVLQEGEIRRVGENTVQRVDVRVICATNKNLAELVKRGEFMRDLYYRINKFPIHIPPLRERPEDIPILVQHFLDQALGTHGERREITRDAMELLASRSWSENNIRELRNTVELAADFATDNLIDRQLIERILRIQKGERAGGEKAASTFAPEEIDGAEGLLRIRRDGFRRLLERSGHRADEKRLSEREKKAGAPFYKLQLEFNGRVIVEGLRSSDWKLRPAAKALGISPMKLRGELRDFIRKVLEESGGDVRETARRLDVPPAVLRRKVADLGLRDLVGDDRKS